MIKKLSAIALTLIAAVGCAQKPEETPAYDKFEIFTPIGGYPAYLSGDTTDRLNIWIKVDGGAEYFTILNCIGSARSMSLRANYIRLIGQKYPNSGARSQKFVQWAADQWCKQYYVDPGI